MIGYLFFKKKKKNLANLISNLLIKPKKKKKKKKIPNLLVMFMKIGRIATLHINFEKLKTNNDLS